MDRPIINRLTHAFFEHRLQLFLFFQFWQCFLVGSSLEINLLLKRLKLVDTLDWILRNWLFTWSNKDLIEKYSPFRCSTTERLFDFFATSKGVSWELFKTNIFAPFINNSFTRSTESYLAQILWRIVFPSLSWEFGFAPVSNNVWISESELHMIVANKDSEIPNK